MTESKLILIADVIEQKLRKEKELEFYLKELENLRTKIMYLQQEVNLTNTIIDMIKTEQVLDLKQQVIEKKNSDKLN
jgi:hypothetical protein